MKQKTLTSLIYLSLAFQICYANVQNTTPEKLMEAAHEAVLNEDVETLQKLIITDEERTQEDARALAELIIFNKNHNYATFNKENRAAIKKINQKPLARYLMAGYMVSLMPSFKECAENGSYVEDKNEFRAMVETNGRKREFVLEVINTDSGWKFWPKRLSHDAPIKATYNIVKEYMSAIQDNPPSQHQKAIDAIIAKHIKPTELKYKDQALKGMIQGNAWTMKTGVAKQKTTFGKNEIRLTLTNGKYNREECPYLPNGPLKVILSLPETGEYDLAMNGINVTLQHNNHAVIVNDGKIKINLDDRQKTLTGQIAAKLDDDNYVNGSFSIPYCVEEE